MLKGNVEQAYGMPVILTASVGNKLFNNMFLLTLHLHIQYQVNTHGLLIIPQTHFSFVFVA